MRLLDRTEHMATHEYRDPDMWSERSPEEIWTAYRHSRDQLLNELFRAGRPSSAFSIREPRIAIQAENGTGI